MRVIRSTPDMIAARAAMRADPVRVGFVPTMGYLHEGHLSLVQLARAQAAVTVVSLFVNPTQFGPNEDFEKYPRDEARDLALCEKAGVDLVFIPQPGDMYAADASVSIVERKLSGILCGRSRPGHFDGVCTIVAKLFHVVQPAVAVFGQKDAQQVAVIKRMVRDLFMPVEIVVGEIVREPDGLAMSSRNVYLSAGQRHEALGLSATLQGIRQRWREGARSAAELEAWGRQNLEHHYQGIILDYLVICDPATLLPCDRVGQGALVAIAAKVGVTRLIDNILI
jgi:pantoate--beta-alanine ligase